MDEDEQFGDVSAEDDITGEINLSELEQMDEQVSLADDNTLGESTLDINSDLGDDLEDDLLEELTEEPTSNLSLDEDLLVAEDDLTGDIPTDLEEEFVDDTSHTLPGADELEVETSQQEADDEEEYEPLDGPLDKIVEKLPFLKPLIDKLAKRNQDEEDDFDEATKTEINNSKISAKKKTDIKKLLSEKLPFLSKLLNKKSNNEEDEDFDPDSVTPISYGDEGEEEEKPKKKITPIHIVVILGIILLGYDTLMEEPEPIGKPVLKKIVRQKKKPAVKKPVNERKEVVDSEQKPKEVEPVSVEPVESEPTEVKPVVDQPVIKDVKEESLDDLFADDDPINKIKVKPEASDTKSELKVDSSDLDALADDENESEQLGTGQSDISTGEDPFGDMPISDGVIDNSLVGDSTSTDITESILKDLEVRVESTKKLKKIEKALKPVDAPEYDMQGRALVYNCSGKHWACIDSVNYKICGQNYSWNSEKGKTIECYPADSYDSAEDCTIIQQIKIDNVADTGFCQ